MSAIINIATKAAYAAANIIQHANGRQMKIEKKAGQNNFATEFDKLAEKTIIDIIKKAFPDHNILAEESGEYNNSSSKYTWIIDPIDGTTNFIHGHPQYSISIGVKQGEARRGKARLGAASRGEIQSRGIANAIHRR